MVPFNELPEPGSPLWASKQFVRKVVERYGNGWEVDPPYHPSEELRMDRDFVKEMVKLEWVFFQWASEELKQDHNFVMEVMCIEGRSLEWASEELRGDRDIVMTAVGNYGDALEYASEGCRSDRDIVMTAAKNNPLALRWASRELRGDREIVMTTICKNGFALEYTSEECRSDPCIVTTAVRNASRELQGNREMILAAIRRSLLFASEELRKDRNFVMNLVGMQGQHLEWASVELRGDQEIVMTAVRNHGNALQFASDECRSDRHIVRTATRKDPYAFRWASKELRGDRDIVLENMQKSSVPIAFASEELKNDREFMMGAVTRDGRCLRHASEELKKDHELVRAAVMTGGGLSGYASLSLRSDPNFVREMIAHDTFAIAHATSDVQADIDVIEAACSSFEGRSRKGRRGRKHIEDSKYTTPTIEFLEHHDRDFGVSRHMRQLGLDNRVLQFEGTEVLSMLKSPSDCKAQDTVLAELQSTCERGLQDADIYFSYVALRIYQLVGLVGLKHHKSEPKKHFELLHRAQCIMKEHFNPNGSGRWFRYKLLKDEERVLQGLQVLDVPSVLLEAAAANSLQMRLHSNFKVDWTVFPFYQGKVALLSYSFLPEQDIMRVHLSYFENGRPYQPVSPPLLQMVEIEVNLKDLKGDIQELKTRLESLNFYQDSEPFFQSLYRHLIKPVEHLPKGFKGDDPMRLRVVTHPELTDVPWWGLMDEDNEQLFEKFIVSETLTSRAIRCFEETRFEQMTEATREMRSLMERLKVDRPVPLLVGCSGMREGGSEFEKDFPLQYEKEFEILRQIGGKDSTKEFLEAEAKLEKVLESMKLASLIHISAHGSALGIQLHDGKFLTTKHLDEMKPLGMVVTLSACYGASLGRSASINGAVAVLAPLWNASDAACAKLTRLFYRQRFEEGKADDEALCHVMRVFKHNRDRLPQRELFHSWSFKLYM